jgi:hypothetical protein
MQEPASFAEAERQLKDAAHLAGEQLAALLELNPKTPLPDLLRTYIIGALRDRPQLPVGRKARFGARWDFTMADVIALYDDKLREFRAENKEAREAGVKRTRADLSAHERAATAVLQEMKAELGNMSIKRLLNIMSEIKKRDFPEWDEVEPEDVPDVLPSKRRRA